MAKGISVWLDVPLEALARRISAVGTNSRPLLHHDSGDAYNRVSSFSALLLYWVHPPGWLFWIRFHV